MNLRKTIDYILCKINNIEIQLRINATQSNITTRDESYSTNPFTKKLPQTYIWIEQKNKCDE